MSEESKNCPKCGASIPENAPEGLCPKCLLLGANMETEPGYTSTMRIPKPAAPSVGQLAASFPQLEILELIGQGGMGYVYKARQQRLDRVVALKILPESLANDPAFAERFSREGRLLARLNHPNIVTVHDFGVTNPTPAPSPEGVSQETVATAAPKGESAEPTPVAPTHRYYYLVMEYIDGANLRQAMQAGRFTPEQALNVVPKVCDALQYAHDEGVLHRDIKPENILVDTKGRVKIADFGIAKMVDTSEGKSDVTLTGEGSTLGTPHYMAPEQIEQPSKVDHRADIYSLGVVFYEMLTGELPIGRFAAPSEKTSVTARVDEIVFRALEKERELRQQSATEIKTAVEDAAQQPPPLKQPRGEVLKTAQCFITQPDHLQTFKARFAHPFTAAGDLMLERDKLVFESNGSEMVFPLKCVRDVSVGQLEWWSQKGGISIISLTIENEGMQRTFMLRPMGPWPEPVLQSNRHCAEWVDAIREGVAAAAGNEPRETPAESLPFPPAPKWIMPVCITTAFFAPLFAFMGAEIVGNGERHDEALPIVLGFGLIGLVLLAVLFAFVAGLTFTTTRWALGRGNLHGLTLPGGSGNEDAKKNASIGTCVAFGVVLLYGLVAACLPVSSIFGIGESGFVGLALLAMLASAIGAVALRHRPEPPRAWLRSASVVGFLLSFPVVGFGAFFLYAAAEMRSWNPATSEAVLVPLFIIGTILLPWAAIHLHGACRPAPAPADQPALNPWPRRIFLLIVFIIVAPIVLFGVMLVVPYLAWNQNRSVPNAQVSLASVATTENLVLVDLNLWTRDRRFSLSPHYTGPALSEELTNSTPRPGNMGLIFPTPVGSEPAVHLRLDATQIGDRPTNHRLAFALKDAATANAASQSIRKSFDKMRGDKPHVRSQLFLFHIKHDDGTESYASLNFEKARRFWVLDQLSPGVTPQQRTDYSEVLQKKLELRRDEIESLARLENLPVTLAIKELDLVSIADKTSHEVAAGEKRPKPRMFENRVVRAEIEIKTEPGVPAIGFNYRGERLESELLESIETPLHHSKVKPSPGVSQLAYQLPRAVQPETILSTTMMIPLPDEAAAREVMRQLESVRRQPLSRVIDRDPSDGQLKLGLFEVKQTTKGAYTGWFVFAPPRKRPGPPLPPAFTSAAAASKAAKYDREKLVGSWEFRLPPLAKGTITFADDGRFTKDITVLLKQSASLGDWRIEDESIITEVKESDNAKEIGKIYRVEIISLDDTVFVTRNLGKSGKPILTTFHRVLAPRKIDRAADTATRRTFDLRHKLASTMKEELRGILSEQAGHRAVVSENNLSLQVNAPREVLDRVQTIITVMDWPTGIARRPDFEYTRRSVMDAARSFLYACAIEDDHRAINKMLSLSALNRLMANESLGPEFLMNDDKRAIFEKQLRVTDWPGKEQKIKDLVTDINKHPLKSLREEPGVAIGFGARHFVTAAFGGEKNRILRLSISMEQRKDENSPIRYLIDNWTVVSE